MTNYFKAIDSRGNVYTRSSGRTYSHAVAVNPHYVQWASRYDLALKVSTVGGKDIMPAVVIDRKEYRAILNAARKGG